MVINMKAKKESRHRKNKKIKKREQFRRIRNKNEAVYRTPNFFESATGVSLISESGIFQIKEGFTKMYRLPEGINIEEIHKICVGFRTMNADIGFFKRRGADQVSLLLYAEKQNIQEAQAWFEKAELQDKLKTVNAEERMEEYCSFLSEVLKKENKVDSYLTETQKWKALAKLEGAVMKENGIRTESGVFQIMAVRSFQMNIKEKNLAVLTAQDCVMASYIGISSVSDEIVAELINSKYLGVEGILPRMRRKNPVLFDILNQDWKNSEEESSDTQGFILGTVYFLLQATNLEEMKAEQVAFQRKAAEYGITVEALTWKSNRMTREQKEWISMFGMSGKRQKEYRCVLSTEAIEKLLPRGTDCRKPDQGESYDIAEMKALFFEEGTDVGENERK